MDSYLKVGSVKKDTKNCNCITPFYLNDISGINPNTRREYSREDKDAMKTALYRISNAKGCELNTCCDPNDPNKKPDEEFTKQFLKKYPKIMPMYERSSLVSIKLSKKPITANGWITPSSYMICKITKAQINDTDDPDIQLALTLVNDCFTNQCSNIEEITVNNLLENSKSDMKYTYLDDARVEQAIRESNISYVKEYITKYKNIDIQLTNNDYNNRMIHIASESSSTEILNMLIALKANLNIQNKLNETPIHFAVRSKNIDNIDILLSQGVDLSLKTIYDETPIFYAMKSGNLRIIKLLYNNNSPISNLDKEGNNLIHYCIKHCPSFKSDEDERGIDKNDKSNIIKFLIERGISSEHQNKDGITPLELTQKEINREINRECAEGIEKENNDVNEYFFNMKPIREGFNSNNSNSNSNKTNKNNNKYGAKLINKDINKYTIEHQELLEIQTLLFNNIIRNNPNKYNNYISVDDIPKGSPIEVLDTVCVGSGMTGNEDSEECIAKGGELIKIKNRTTKIKVELLPEEETKIDELNDKDLYFPKHQPKIPKSTLPVDINNYNKSLSFNNTHAIQVPQTPGITYNLGESSNNEIKNTNNTNTKTNNTNNTNTNNTTKTNNEIKVPQLAEQTIQEPEITRSPEHPPLLDDYDDFVHKCKRDALRNSEIISETTNPMTTKPITTKPIVTQQTFIDKYKLPLIIVSIVIVLLIVSIIVYHFFFNNNNNYTN